MKKLLIIFICIPLASQELTDVLWEKENLSRAFHYDVFNKSIAVLPSSNKKVEGIFSINSNPRGRGFTINVDHRNIYQESHQNLPEFHIKFSIVNGTFNPSSKKIIKTSHPFWNIQFGTGVVKYNKESNQDVVYYPFNLIHKNANCVHNGIGVFALSGNNISNALFQIASETCAYYQFDLVSVNQAMFIETDSDILMNERIHPIKYNKTDIKSIRDIYQNYDVNNKSFADSSLFNEDEVTIYGLINGKSHYTSACKTRLGNHPFCDEIILPSYSLAKSLSGTLGLSLIEDKHGSINNLYVKDLIKECDQRKWNNVTLENLSDMATGQYINSTHDLDERGTSSSAVIFNLSSHNEKLNMACKAFPKKRKPGIKFVYHTSDTYILGAALNSYLIANTNDDDFFSDYVKPFFKTNQLSQVSEYILRTDDDVNHPYTGWGMFFVLDDLFTISLLLHDIKNNNSSRLSFLKDALNPDYKNSILAIPEYNIYYNNGFWSRKFDKNIFNCKEDIWIPFMSGFGGITYALLPNGMTYYYFSDGYTFAWESAVIAANQIKPFCN